MKKDAISTGMFIAIGFLCVAIVIAVLIPVVRDVVDKAAKSKPDIPAVSMIQPADSVEAAVTCTIPGPWV
ncbi:MULTISPECIES: hypothetical protein [unclassified Paenibacillus]|uniref:hypothetical protein n=1 Tax=unclassified Paenibacillus TaxID=185978 RepID=UPI0003E1CE8F|nr:MULTISPECIES: hypothetical protein [unclassified Paenibacillus]ETT45667.1 hypothetical protein C162_20076 [Paenibacillus sp. FSL R7-269]OMF91703.1 hypothetical protein BK147_21175 [Paenibacillus sp. FSL R7-0337]